VKHRKTWVTVWFISAVGAVFLLGRYQGSRLTAG
jgi:hypothetical protein